MWLLYVEILVLLTASFVGGCLVAATAVRLLVRRTEPAPEAVNAPADPGVRR